MAVPKTKRPCTMKETAPITYPLRVQAIRTRGQAPRLYVTFPMALAAAIGLEAGDEVQWELLDRAELHLVRVSTPEPQARSRAAKSAARPS